MKLKVCGMKYPDNIEQVAALNPDYMGFIFYPGSMRFVDAKTKRLPESVKKTGVFVNASLEEVLETCNLQDLGAIQLHGDESPEYCRSLNRMTLAEGKIELIKAFAIGDSLPVKELETYAGVCDYFLFDTKGKQRGGSGQRFDWSVLEAYSMDQPYFLSGGIGPEHLKELKEFLGSGGARNCCGIDLNSRFEEAPGKKDLTRLKTFIEEFKNLVL